MGFTTKAFIRKNPDELREKLNGLGYRLFGVNLNELKCIFTDPKHGLYTIEFYSKIDAPYISDYIDCGYNEELFLALAALRDDSDYMQWFTDGDHWFKCGDTKLEMTNEIDGYLYLDNLHKATVEELIAHFKGHC